MALPAHRSTSSKKRSRAAHFRLKMKALTVCRKCKAKTMPHRACVSCGTYAGRAVIAMAKPGSKKKHSHKKDAS